MLIHNKIKRLIGILAVILAGGAALTNAQNTPLLEKLSVEDGLSQGLVYNVIQDKEGFLWFCTKNGLNRYDGREFKVFTHDPLDPSTIPENNVLGVQEFGEYLFVRTQNGFCFFHKKTHRFYPFQAPASLQNKLTGLCLSALLDREGRLLCCIRRLDGRSDLLQITLQEPINSPLREPGNPFLIKSIQALATDAEMMFLIAETRDGVWGIAGERLFKLNSNTLALEYPRIPSGALENSFFLDKDSVLWVGCRLGYIKIAGQQVQWTETGFEVRRILCVNDQLLLSNGLKIYRLNRSSADKPRLLESDIQILLTLEKGEFSTIYTDRSGILWIGTNGYGLLKYSPRLQRFKTLFPGVFVQNYIWVDNAGGLAFKPVRGKLHASSPAMMGQNAWGWLPTGTQVNIDKQGDTWIVTNPDKSEVLLVYHQAGVGKHWEKIFQLPLENSGNRAFAVLADKQDRLWIANSKGLVCYDRQTQKLDSFYSNRVLVSSRRINAIQQTVDGTWWIGTQLGLFRAIPDGNSYAFEQLSLVQGEKSSFATSEVSSLFVDPSQPHILWVGTMGSGLIRVDTRSGTFKHLNTRNGFPDNVIYGVLNDKQGRLWLSSNQGLIRFDPASGSLRQYTVRDGLPANEFNSKAFAKKTDGTLLFGGVEGLVAFNPDDFDDNPVTPLVRITGLEVNNWPITFGDSTRVLKQAIEFTNHLVLPYSQNSITLKFAALEYSVPTQNKFQYYLKGAEQEWAHSSTENTASYLNLAPGRYTFLVKACNSDGVWNETPTVLQIVILPPWYRTIWAYSLYGLLLLCIAYGLLRFFLHRQRLQYKLDLEHREAERFKELDAFKSQVFTNITHEFRTPLTVIQGMADRMENSESDRSKLWVRQTGALIKRNGAVLLRLINQLLDLAKLEANALTLNPEPTDLVPFVKYLAGSFQSLAINKDIEFEVLIDQPSIPIAIDKDQTRAIVHNLLANAVKFTPAKGRISLHLSQLDSWENALGPAHFRAVTPIDGHNGGWVSIRVLDTGAGIAPERLPHVFDRFFQSATKEGGGSGIGLALVKELVQLMQGALAVHSEPSQGTEFVVLLPIQRVAQENGLSLSLEQVAIADAVLPIAIPDPAPAPSGANEDMPTLLIIEDNPDVRHYLITCTEGAYKVSTAENGQQGIDLALETVPDIVVSDVMMPLKDGFEVVQTLKNDERSSHIPIVLLTARADLDSRLKGLERGADVYLAKPFDQQELLVYLRKLLELRRKLQERYAQGGELASGVQTHYEDIFIQKVQSVLEDNLDDEAFGIHELCRALQLSRAQLHNKLKALTGRSASLYIRSVRLHRARQLLLSTDRNVSEIAFEVGFRHLQHFSTSFAEEFGQSPSSLRK